MNQEPNTEPPQVAPREAQPLEEVKQNPFTVLVSTSMGGHLSWFESDGGRWFVKPVCHANTFEAVMVILTLTHPIGRQIPAPRCRRSRLASASQTEQSRSRAVQHPSSGCCDVRSDATQASFAIRAWAESSPMMTSLNRTKRAFWDLIYPGAALLARSLQCRRRGRYVSSCAEAISLCPPA